MARCISIGALLLAGCLSSDPVKFESLVRTWVPLATPLAEATRIMEHHGFECHFITTSNLFNTTGFDYLDCDREQVRFHDWSARFIIQDGKVSSYGRLNTK